MLTPPLLNVVVKPPCTPTSTLSSDSDENHCWICMEPGESTPRSVCGCKNAVAHVECIEKWIKSKPEFSMNCEVCLQPYKVEWSFEENEKRGFRPRASIILPIVFASLYGTFFVYFPDTSAPWAAWTGNACIILSWLFFACISRRQPLHQKYLGDDLCTLLISYGMFLVAVILAAGLYKKNTEVRIHTAHTCNIISLLCATCTRTVCVHCVS